LEVGEEIRIVTTAGRSLVIALPREFTERNGIGKGSKVRCLYNDVLLVEPLKGDELTERMEGKRRRLYMEYVFSRNPEENARLIVEFLRSVLGEDRFIRIVREVVEGMGGGR